MAMDPTLDMDDDDLQDSPAAASDDVSDSVGSSAAMPTPAPSGAPAPINPQLAAYLQNKQDMEAAQKTSATNRLLAGIGRAAGTLARGSSQVTGADNAAYNALDQAADAPVQDIMNQQKSEAQEVSNEANAESNDPSSAKSKAVQQMIAKLYPGKFSPEQLSKISAADAQDVVFKPLELDEKIKETAANHQMLRDDREEKARVKATEAQSKVYTTMRKDLESFRGNQSVQQAALAIPQADRALAIAQAAPTTANLTLLADELAKIATGGVPGEHGVQALVPNNLYTKVADMKAWVTGHPNASTADVSEYIRNNVEYINQVKDIAKKTLHDYRTNIAKGYRARVSPDQFQEATDDYGLGGERAPDSGKPGPGNSVTPKTRPGSIVKVKGTKYRVGADGDTLEPVQ